VERLYDISAGVAEAIVAQGLDAEGALRLDESTFDQIAAHRHAADLVGDAVRADRPMSTGLLKEFHAAVTSAQPRYKAVDQFGRAVQGALLHGEYKTEDNHVPCPAAPSTTTRRRSRPPARWTGWSTSWRRRPTSTR